MKLQRKVELSLKPEEVEKILKKHFKSVEGIDIDSVSFSVGIVYGEYDDRGSYKLTSITCRGIEESYTLDTD